MPGNGTTSKIVSDNPDSKDIAKELTPEAIDAAMEKIIADVPKQPGSH